MNWDRNRAGEETSTEFIVINPPFRPSYSVIFETFLKDADDTGDVPSGS